MLHYYVSYLREIGPFFRKHCQELEKAQRHLEQCPPSALKIGFLIQVNWQLYIASCVPSNAKGLQDFKLFQEKLRTIALSVSHENDYMSELDTIDDEDIDDWILGLKDRACEEDSCCI